MMVSRESFLRICVATLLGQRLNAFSLLTTFADASGAARPARPRSRFRLQDASASLFRPHVNSAFAVRTADGARVRLVLSSVTERPLDKRVDQFSLVFHGPPGAAVPDGAHEFQHASLGSFELFIALIGGPNRRCSVYEACFSKVRSEERYRTAENDRRARWEDEACQLLS